VERILGRPARTYAEWVADHDAAFRPSGSRPGPVDPCRSLGCASEEQ
jgi:hypothetical protein